jgi:VIT1/CCC1 family predicted Fe2+/Mn2+ transporter
MRRLRIKKKETILPFRETVAFRFMMVAISTILFVVAAFQIPGAIRRANTTFLIVTVVVTVAMAGLTLFNLSQISRAKIPKSARQRMNRARR